MCIIEEFIQKGVSIDMENEKKVHELPICKYDSPELHAYILEELKDKASNHAERLAKIEAERLEMRLDMTKFKSDLTSTRKEIGDLRVSLTEQMTRQGEQMTKIQEKNEKLFGKILDGQRDTTDKILVAQENMIDKFLEMQRINLEEKKNENSTKKAISLKKIGLWSAGITGLVTLIFEVLKLTIK